MAITPRSCRTPSAAIVCGRTRWRSAVQSPARAPGASTCTAATIARCSASAPTPNGTVGEVEDVSTRSRPARASRSGAWPPPQPSMWNAWTVRPPNAAAVSSTESASFMPSVWMASWTSCRSARSSAQRICSGPAPTSSWILRPAPPARSAASTGSGRADDARTSSAALTGYCSSAAQVAARPAAGFVPRFQIGPKSWMTSVVSPPASAVSATWGESQCTCGSTPPGVTIMPVASTTAVLVSSTTAMPSIVSGLPARPIATMRPSRTPRLVARTPSTGSATSPPTIAISTPPRSARTPRPSRIVLPKPGRIRSGPPPPAWAAGGRGQGWEPGSRVPSGTAVPPRAGERQRRLLRAVRVERPVGEPGVAADDALAAEREQDDVAGPAGVEEHLGAGRDGQPHAPGGGAVEAQHAVDLEEVEVRGDADRVLALVDDGQRGPVGEPRDAHLALGRRLARADRVVQDDQAAAVGEERLHLDPRYQLRHAGEDVVRRERAVALRLGGRVGGAVAGGLAHRVGDHRHRLRLAEPEPARLPLARQLGGEEQQEAVLLAGEEAHRRANTRRRCAG